MWILRILVNLLDIACDLENEGLDMEAYNIALTERPEYTLLATAYASTDYESWPIIGKTGGWRTGSTATIWTMRPMSSWISFITGSLI